MCKEPVGKNKKQQQKNTYKKMNDIKEMQIKTIRYFHLLDCQRLKHWNNEDPRWLLG